MAEKNPPEKMVSSSKPLRCFLLLPQERREKTFETQNRPSPRGIGFSFQVRGWGHPCQAGAGYLQAEFWLQAYNPRLLLRNILPGIYIPGISDICRYTYHRCMAMPYNSISTFRRKRDRATRTTLSAFFPAKNIPYLVRTSGRGHSDCSRHDLNYEIWSMCSCKSTTACVADAVYCLV